MKYDVHYADYILPCFRDSTGNSGRTPLKTCPRIGSADCEHQEPVEPIRTKLDCSERLAFSVRQQYISRYGRL
jgi:hypothetical protein